MVQLRTTVVASSLALLTSAAYSSHQPLAFTSSTNNYNNALPSGGPFSTRVRKRVLARTFLQANPTDQSEFRRGRVLRTSISRTSSSSSTRTRTDNNNSGISSSSTLSMIVDSEKEFEISLGRAVDTLKKDYPDLLTKNPAWHIYDPNLEVIDPTGVSLHGVENYKMAFGFIHMIVKWFYCPEKSLLTFRQGYDFARKCIRVSWNVELVPKRIYGGVRNTLHVDGISEYYLDRESGLITEHRVSHLLINDQAVRPANGVFNALAEMSPVTSEGVPQGVPSFLLANANTNNADSGSMTLLKFQTWNPLNRQAKTSLFANPNEQAMRLPNDSTSSEFNTDSPVPYDRDALQRKNDSRKKFGMPPITPEEYVVIEEEVRTMDATNKKKAAYLAEKMQIAREDRKKEKEEGFMSNLFGAFKNGCESNFDCERPKVCCDIGFKKICCSNGLGIVEGVPLERLQRGVLRVPIPNDNIDW